MSRPSTEFVPEAQEDCRVGRQRVEDGPHGRVVMRASRVELVAIVARHHVEVDVDGDARERNRRVGNERARTQVPHFLGIPQGKHHGVGGRVRREIRCQLYDGGGD